MTHLTCRRARLYKAKSRLVSEKSYEEGRETALFML